MTTNATQLTSAILIANVRKTPNITQIHSKSDDRQEEFYVIVPIIAFLLLILSLNATIFIDQDSAVIFNRWTLAELGVRQRVTRITRTLRVHRALVVVAASLD